MRNVFFFQSMAMMILCPDEEMDEVDVEEKQSTGE